MDETLTLQHADVIGDGEALHLARATLTSRRPKALHGHDFYELLWVQNGTVVHHLPGMRETLGEGDVLFLRPGDVHGLQGRGEAAMVVSVSFRPGMVDSLGQRHDPLRGRLFWARGGPIPRVRRDPRQMADLNRAALALERGRRRKLEAEAFLLPLCIDLLDATPDLPPEAPEWLARACAAASDPAVFRDGAAGFARVAGRAHPHVSRTVRRFLGQSPSDYVNGQRMAYAARQLTSTADSLAEIAADCGIPNLSHFHKLFRAQFGTTPQRYRRARQTEVVQP